MRMQGYYIILKRILRSGVHANASLQGVPKKNGAFEIETVDAQHSVVISYGTKYMKFKPCLNEANVCVQHRQTLLNVTCRTRLNTVLNDVGRC